MKEQLNEYFRIFKGEKGIKSKMPEIVFPAIESLVEKSEIAGQHTFNENMQQDIEYFLVNGK